MTMQVDKARLDEMLASADEACRLNIGDWTYKDPTIDFDTMRSIITELLELRSLRSTEGKEGAKTVAYLIDCPVEPCLEFADVDVPDAAIPLVRRSDLAAAEASAKAARENFLTMQGSAAQLLSRAEAAEAHVAKLEAALKAIAGMVEWPDSDMGYVDLARAALTRSPE